MSTPAPGPTLAPPPNFSPDASSSESLVGATVCEFFYTTAVEGSTYLVATPVPVPTEGANVTDVVCIFGQVPATFTETPSPTSLLLPANITAAFPDFFTETIDEGDGVVETFTVPVSDVLEETATAAAVSTTSHSKNVTGPVVGSIVGAIVLALLVGGFLLWRKRKHRQQATGPSHEWAQAPGKWTFRGQASKEQDPSYKMNKLNETTS